MALKNTVHIESSEFRKVISNLDKLKNEMLDPKHIRRIKVLATKPMQDAIRNLIHDSGRTRTRGYATYTSGNLKKSIRVLPLKKRQLVYLGVRVLKEVSGTYGTGNRANGWYGHFVEYGTKGGQGNGKGIVPQIYFRKGVKVAESQSMAVMQKEIKRKFDSIKLNG